MIHVLTLFPQSIDGEEVDEFLKDQVLPNLTDVPGLRSVRFSKGQMMSPGGPPVFAKVLEYEFGSLQEMMDWAQGSSACAIKEQLEAYGAVLLFYEVENPLPA